MFTVGQNLQAERLTVWDERNLAQRRRANNRGGWALTRRRKIEMVVERDEIVLVRRRQSAVRFWCNPCEAEVSMLRVQDASSLVGVTARTIYRWIEAGKLHFAESDKGLVLICARSLTTFAAQNAGQEKKGEKGSQRFES